MLLFYTLFRLAIATVSMAIGVKIFALQLPPFERMFPGHFLRFFAIHGDADTGVAYAIHHYFVFLSVEYDPIYAESFNVFVGQVRIMLRIIPNHPKSKAERFSQKSRPVLESYRPHRETSAKLDGPVPQRH